MNYAGAGPGCNQATADPAEDLLDTVAAALRSDAPEAAAVENDRTDPIATCSGWMP